MEYSLILCLYSYMFIYVMVLKLKNPIQSEILFLLKPYQISLNNNEYSLLE